MTTAPATLSAELTAAAHAVRVSIAIEYEYSKKRPHDPVFQASPMICISVGRRIASTIPGDDTGTLERLFLDACGIADLSA